MAVDWVGIKPGEFINNSVITPIDASNMNAIVDTISAIAIGGASSGVNADLIQGIDLQALNTPSDEYLVNFYSMDSLLGSASEFLLDESGIGNNGTCYNVVPIKGIVGMAGSFNGTSAYATGPYANQTAITLAVWYKGTNTAVSKPLFLLKRANNATKIGLYLNEGIAQLRFYNTDSVVTTISGSLVNDGQFHLIVGTHSGTSAKIYIDGRLVESINQSLTTQHFNQWILGAGDEITPSTFTQCYLDDARVYSNAITADEVYGLFFTKISTKVNLITSTAVANSHAFRDSNGRTQVIAGVDSLDAVNKSQIDLKADLASPALTGTPTTPTAVSGTNTTQIASTAFVIKEAIKYALVMG